MCSSDLGERGVLFLAAAGNEPTTAPNYPAAYPEVLAVTAGGRNGQLASYANRGDFVDVAAPGSSIIHFDGKAYLVSGTSVKDVCFPVLLHSVSPWRTSQISRWFIWPWFI